MLPRNLTTICFSWLFCENSFVKHIIQRNNKKKKKTKNYTRQESKHNQSSSQVDDTKKDFAERKRVGINYHCSYIFRSTAIKKVSLACLFHIIVTALPLPSVCCYYVIVPNAVYSRTQRPQPKSYENIFAYLGLA